METNEILKSCRIIGRIVYLPDIQLDRKQYLEVAQKLELIGGKWSRKEKGFLFEQDPTALLNDISSGEKRNIKKEFQFFETPESLADELCSYIPMRTVTEILEPSAGRGSIVRSINKLRPDIPVYYCELMDLNRKMFKGRAEFICNDFFELPEGPEAEKFDVIIANPPFSKNQDIDHFYKMYRICCGRIISIMSRHWQYCNNKKETDFRNFLKENNAQIIDLEQGKFIESGTMTAACIVIFDV